MVQCTQNPLHEWTKKLTVFTLRLTLQFHEKFIGQNDAQSTLDDMSETESILISISAFYYTPFSPMWMTS